MRKHSESRGLGIRLVLDPWSSQSAGKLSNPCALYLLVLSNTLAYHFRTIITRFLNEWKISGKHLNFGPVTLRDMSLMKAFNLLLPVFMPNSSCSFSSFCEWGLGLSPGGSSADTLRGTEGYYEANMLRMLPRSAVTHCAVRESWFYCLEIVLIKMNTNKSLELWQLISTEPARLSWRQICLGVSAWLCCWHKKSAPSGWGWCHCVQELLLQWAEMQIVTHTPCNCTTEVKRWSYLSISSNRKFYGLRFFFLGFSWCLN